MHELDRRAIELVRLDLVSHLRDDVVRLRRQPHLPSLMHRVRQRLLTMDVLAKLHRRQRNRSVHVIRRRNDDRIERLRVRIVEQLAIVEELLRRRELLGGAAEMIGRLVDVAQRDDVDVRTLGGLDEVRPAFASRTDRRDVELLVRAVNAAPTGGGERRRGSSNNTVLQKITTSRSSGHWSTPVEKRRDYGLAASAGAAGGGSALNLHTTILWCPTANNVSFASFNANWWTCIGSLSW